ncbi:hypothetical protein LEMLEM_LOCUS26681 [Lemmus lemmus]
MLKMRCSPTCTPAPVSQAAPFQRQGDVGHVLRHGLKEPLVGMMDLKQLLTNSSFIKKISTPSVWKPQPLPPASTYHEAE